MSDKFFKVKRGLNVQPIDPSTITDAEAGDLILDSTSGNALKSYNPISDTFEEVRGQGGGFNYFENSGAEVDLSGFTVYANTTPSTRPDDFGGTPDAGFTLTRNTTDPLLGQADFLITKPASNVQGNGIYYQFTAENGHLASKLLFQTLADTDALNDVDISIHLVSSSDSFVADFNVISANNPDVSAGPPQIMKQFQLDSSDTEYRLCIHYNSTDVVAKTFRLDELKFAPSSVATSPVVTDPKFYVPQNTNGFGVIVNPLVMYWREGRFLHVNGRFVSGTNAAVEAQIGLPSGLVIDDVIIPSRNLVGIYERNLVDGTVADYHVLAAGGDNFVNIGRRDTSVSGLAPANGNQVISSSQAASFDFKVPIQGWSANTISSEDLGGRDVHFRASNIPTQSLGNVIFNTVDDDTNGSFDIGTGIYTIPEGGKYNIHASVPRNSSNTDFRLRLIVNGTTVVENLERTGAIGASNQIGITLTLNKGDLVNLNSSQNFGSGVQERGSFSITKLASPQTILETETVAAKYTSDSGQSISSGGSTLIYENLVYDTHNAYDVSTGIYTIPVSGFYSINPKYRQDTTTADLVTSIQVNNVTLSATRVRGVSNNFTGYDLADFYLNKGDEILIRAQSQNTGNMNTQTIYNQITFKRIK